MSEESIIDELFAALNVVVLERLEYDSFKLIGTAPIWFVQFYGDTDLQQQLMPGHKFPVLDNFLIDAEAFWQKHQSGRIKSGLWTETDLSGQEFYLEASAVCLNEKKILLIASNYKEHQFLLQKARENSLNYYNLLKEIQKKEVLIHCIVHDLAGQLTGIKYCFELLSLQNLNSKAQEYLNIGKKQCQKQETLIREILDAFAAEIEILEGVGNDSQQAPDALACVLEVVNALSPVFFLNQIDLRLQIDVDKTREWKVVGEKSRLERTITNLVENAYRHSPPNSAVTIEIAEEGDFMTIAVDDMGSGIEPEIATTLFQKFSQGKNRPGRIGLGLYFCRITVEQWGGSIGYKTNSQGGAQFWFRLPKILSE
ncbi:HAMP domain-containing histidine kinase [Chroococcidiopsis sp. FACHB-1243]|uniref:sensor histidine kinase n=1 Tax=Chroococcidiopsis sp. [FACHB-1243] TaxID=2692781 RepID=UPI00178612DF|nr:HAMP domain-containing sensor histidine kinase [Chroococcidiopsis sp. [FACHB-1243]]MBD2304134.1 HAMP domain-containing histidine kinase [Chroococcidiopsis sp. [FACHB-1243]]